MYCLGIMDSGNYAFNICSILRGKGYMAEVVSTPCQITFSGCGYCLKFPDGLKDIVVNESRLAGLPVRAVYRVFPEAVKGKYQRIF
ncbi:MAG: DUF3343 domain-containing protein [Acetivibrionales bacterium]